jgi:HlyD family secretion protein
LCGADSQSLYSLWSAGENLDRRVIEVKVRLTPQASQQVANLTNLQVEVAIQI